MSDGVKISGISIRDDGIHITWDESCKSKDWVIIYKKDLLNLIEKRMVVIKDNKFTDKNTNEIGFYFIEELISGNIGIGSKAIAKTFWIS